MVSFHHIFWYNPFSLKKDWRPSILTLSNRSLKQFTLKNRFLMRAKALNSMRTYLTVQGVWYVKHCGCCSCFSMKEWVSLVWPIRNQYIMTFSLLDFLKAGLHFSKVGWIWKSLWWVLVILVLLLFYVKEFVDLGFQVSIWNTEIVGG